MSLESDWQDRKAVVYEDIAVLIAAGIPFDTAKRLAGWNPTLAYESFEAMQQGTGTPESGLRFGLTLLVTRSEARTNAEGLNGSVLDAGTLYAVFIPDIPELNIDQIVFKLDGSVVRTELSLPWDYAGTAGGGTATRVSFPAGEHSIEAEVTDAYGTYSFEASFTVE